MKRSFGSISCLLFMLTLCGLLIQGCVSSGTPQAASKSDVHPALASREPILLVCPVNSMISEKETGSLSRILAPLIRRDLFCVQSLSVIPTEDTAIPGKAFFMTESGLVKVTRHHGADMVIVGMLRGDTEKISIELKAYDLKGGYFVLNTTVEGKPSKIFKLQRQLVYEFIDALGIRLSKEEADRIKASSPRKAKAASEYARGLRNEQNKMYTEAIIAYQNATTDDKYIAVPYAGEARIFAIFNAPLRAVESYENAVVRDESFAEAWYQLNLYAAHYKKQDDLAAKYCRKALEIAPRFGKAHMSLGTRLFDLGDVDQAIEETEKAVPLLPADPQSRYNLGIYYLNRNKPEEARTWFEQALRVDPGYELARTELQKLK